MCRVVFAPIIDSPLVAITLGAFLWHFNRWAYRRDIGTTADLPSRLRMREPMHSLHYREGGSLVVVVLAVEDRPIE